MSGTATPQIRSRPLRDDGDVKRVRNLLVETHPISPPGFNWEVRRWDGWRFYNPTGEWDPGWESRVQLWETSDGRLVGAVNPEGSGGDAHLQVHPHYRQVIEEDMVAWAEEHLARPTPEGGRQIAIDVFDYDRPRNLLLEKRGFERTDAGGTFYQLRFGLQAIPEVQLAGGYRLRETRPGVEDAQRLADLLNAAFQRDFHNAEEYMLFARKAPSFRRDLDLIAEAPDGSFASYVGLPYDKQNRYAIFEPVCTHPDHRRKGLAQALMWEALRRAQALGARTASTETGRAAPANRLYESIGFTETYESHVWRS